MSKEKDRGYDPTIVGLLCNWCTYAGADLAGTTRIKHPQNMRAIRIPCSGRVSPHFIFTSLFQGADGVFIGGCHPADCHYTSGNYYARRRFALMKSLLDFVGIEPDRGGLAYLWLISPATIIPMTELAGERIFRSFGGVALVPVALNCLWHGGALFFFRYLCLTHADRHLGRLDGGGPAGALKAAELASRARAEARAGARAEADPVGRTD